MIRYIAAALAFLAADGLIILCIISCIQSMAKARKPRCPKNIKAYAGKYLKGNCPKCGNIVSNCDGHEMGGVSYCSCCGTKIRFPYHAPKLEGVKSVSIEQYTKEGRK